MSENIPYLTGGILFSLLLHARKTRHKARDKLKGGSDHLRETDLMNEINYVLTGNVEIICRLIFSDANVSNILLATPA